MSTPSIANQPIESPELTLNPISWWSWWMTPRSDDEYFAFYERNIRGAILLLLFFVIVSYALDPAQLVRIDYMVIQFGLLLPAMWAVSSNRVRVAGWLLMAYLLGGVFVSDSYWSPTNSRSFRSSNGIFVLPNTVAFNWAVSTLI